jgi:hypothetical protein
MCRGTRKLNPKPPWTHWGLRWKPSLPTGGSTGAQSSWYRRKPIFAPARSGRAETSRARVAAAASSRSVALRGPDTNSARLLGDWFTTANRLIRIAGKSISQDLGSGARLRVIREIGRSDLKAQIIKDHPPVPSQNLNPNVLVMQPTENRNARDVA